MIVDRLSPSTMEENPLWLVVLCDLMTILMLFFLGMFAAGMHKTAQAEEAYARVIKGEELLEERKNPPPPAPNYAEDGAAEKITSMFRDEGLADAVEVIEDADTIRIRLMDSILFKTAEAELNEDASRAIGLLAGVLKELPNEIVVEGHTDSVRITKAEYKSNWELSVARSYSVVARLLLGGVPPVRLVTAGYGKFHPLATNETHDGRARNRRIEVVILLCAKGKPAPGEFDCRTGEMAPL